MAWFSKQTDFWLKRDCWPILSFKSKMHVPKSLDFSSWSIFDEKIYQIRFLTILTFFFWIFRKWIRRCSTTELLARYTLGWASSMLFSTYPLDLTRVSTLPKNVRNGSTEEKSKLALFHLTSPLPRSLWSLWWAPALIGTKTCTSSRRADTTRSRGEGDASPTKHTRRLQKNAQFSPNSSMIFHYS